MNTNRVLSGLVGCECEFTVCAVISRKHHLKFAIKKLEKLFFLKFLVIIDFFKKGQDGNTCKGEQFDLLVGILK